MAKNHLHELFYRTVTDVGVTLQRFAAHHKAESEPAEDLVKLCSGIARDEKALDARKDAIVYRIDGQCEFFVSRYFYLWPNNVLPSDAARPRYKRQR